MDEEMLQHSYRKQFQDLTSESFLCSSSRIAYQMFWLVWANKSKISETKRACSHSSQSTIEYTKRRDCYPVCLPDHNSLSSGTVSTPAEMLMQLRRACSAFKSECLKGQKGQREPFISHLYLFVSATLPGGKRFVFQVWSTGCLLVLGMDELIAPT